VSVSASASEVPEWTAAQAVLTSLLHTTPSALLVADEAGHPASLDVPTELGYEFSTLPLLVALRNPWSWTVDALEQLGELLRDIVQAHVLGREEREVLLEMQVWLIARQHLKPLAHQSRLTLV